MPAPSALACPASLKGVLSAREAAAALEDGFADAGVECVPLPLADGGEGTVDALCDLVGYVEAEDAYGRARNARVGRRDGATFVEAAEVIPFDAERLDVMHASSRGFGELIERLHPERLVIALGGTANMDAGVGLLDVLDALPAPTTVLCDVQTTLYDAPRLFGPQKGATPEQVAELEARFRSLAALAPYAELPAPARPAGSAPHSRRSARSSSPGAAAVLDFVGFDPARV